MKDKIEPAYAAYTQKNGAQPADYLIMYELDWIKFVEECHTCDWYKITFRGDSRAEVRVYDALVVRSTDILFRGNPKFVRE